MSSNQTSGNVVDHDQSLTEPTEAIQSEQVEITRFNEAASEAKTSVAPTEEVQVKVISNPYPDQTPSHILSRNYRLGRMAWTEGIPFIQTYAFPNAMKNIPIIFRTMEFFRWFRGKVKVEIRVNSTQFHYGSLLVSWLPNVVASSVHAGNTFRESGNHPIVLSASTQQSCTLEIPWLVPLQYLEWQSATGAIGTVYIRELNPLRRVSDNVTDTVEVQVFASFVDPEVAGYRPSTEAQAGTGPKRINTSTDEARAKSASGVLTTAASAAGTVSQILRSIPIFGEKYGSIVDAVKPLVGSLDKPRSEMATYPMSKSLMRDLANADGMDNAHVLSVYRHAYLSHEKDLMGPTPTTWLDIAMTPKLNNTTEWLNATVPQTVSVAVPSFSPQTAPNVQEPDYLCFVASFFRYWRGSIKYKFQFMCSIFTSCRFRISVLYTNDVPADTLSGDVISRIVDVKGDTDVEFTVPYLWSTPFRTFLDSDAYPIIHVERMTPIIAPSLEADPSIFMNVWRAAGEDMVFSQMVYPQRTRIPALAPGNESPVAVSKLQQDQGARAEAQSIMTEMFRKTFSPISGESQFTVAQHYACAEQAGGLQDAFKRYSSGSLAGVPEPSVNEDVFHSLCSVFLYWRGSIRLKQALDPALAAWIRITLEDGSPPGITRAGSGMTLTRTEQWPTLEWEIPQYATVPFMPVRNDQVEVYGSRTATRGSDSNYGQVYIAGGEDFNVGFLVAPTPFYL